jgi:hypothetical protein
MICRIFPSTSSHLFALCAILACSKVGTWDQSFVNQMNPWITNFLLLVISSHKSRVGAREARQWACSRSMSVVTGTQVVSSKWSSGSVFDFEGVKRWYILKHGVKINLFAPRSPHNALELFSSLCSWSTTSTTPNFLWNSNWKKCSSVDTVIH